MVNNSVGGVTLRGRGTSKLGCVWACMVYGLWVMPIYIHASKVGKLEKKEADFDAYGSIVNSVYVG